MVGERQGQIVSVGFQWRKRARLSRDVKIPRIFQSKNRCGSLGSIFISGQYVRVETEPNNTNLERVLPDESTKPNRTAV